MDSHLHDEAARRGVSAAELARTILEERLLANGSRASRAESSNDEWKQEFRAWVESHRGLPTLPDEAFRRESMYGNRG